MDARRSDNLISSRGGTGKLSMPARGGKLSDVGRIRTGSPAQDRIIQPGRER